MQRCSNFVSSKVIVKFTGNDTSYYAVSDKSSDEAALIGQLPSLDTHQKRTIPVLMVSTHIAATRKNCVMAR